jgi:hypothetical protein
MAMEPDPKEILGVLMNITQAQQRQTAELLNDIRDEIGKLEVATELAKTASVGIKASAASADVSMAKLGSKVELAASMAVEPAMVKSFMWAGSTSAKAMNDALGPILAKLSSATDKASTAADQADLKMRRAAQWITWKVCALAAAGVVVIWAMAWYGVWSARHEVETLRADIEGMKANIAELENKGGKLTLHSCDGQMCIEVDRDQRTTAHWAVPWGDAKKGYFVIPKWR